MGYKITAIKSLSWMSILELATRVASLLKYAILARILLPNDIGVFGIVVLVVGISEIFSEFGFQTFLIQYRKDIREYINSVWILQILRGIFLFLIITLLALPASVFFRQSSLFFLIFLGAFNPLIKGFENTYIVNFQKELMFEKQFIYKIIMAIVDFIVAIPLTLITHSVIGLVIAMLLSSLSGIVFSWVYINDKPKFEFDLTKIKRFMGYGKWININSILFYITTDIDTLVLGRIMGTGSLGLYQIAQKFSIIPMQEISDIFGQVTFPLYSKIAEDIRRFKNAYLKSLLVLMLVEISLGAFLFLFSKDIIIILLGMKWLSAESIFRVFIIYGTISAFVSTFGSFYLSIGKQDLLSRLNFIRIIFLVPLIIYFINLFGTLGAVYALIISLLITVPFYLYNAIKLFKINYE